MLVWSIEKGLEYNNCVEVFFKLKKRLEAKKEYYEKKYGFLPDFKAGVHGGNVILAKIGTLKKELAYHGDVINTSARIQSICNQYQEQLLVSEMIWNIINGKEQYQDKVYIDTFLKGKDEKLTLFGIQKN